MMVDVLAKEAFGMLVARKVGDLKEMAEYLSREMRDRVSPFKSEELTNLERLLGETAHAIKRYREASEAR